MAAFATGSRGQFPACSRSLTAQPLFTTSPECCYQHGSPLHQNIAVNICSVVIHRFIRMLLSTSAQSWFTTLSERCCQHGSPLHQNVAVSICSCCACGFLCGCSSGTVKPTNGMWCSAGYVSRQVWATVNTHEQ